MTDESFIKLFRYDWHKLVAFAEALCRKTDSYGKVDPDRIVSYLAHREFMAVVADGLKNIDHAHETGIHAAADRLRDLQRKKSDAEAAFLETMTKWGPSPAAVEADKSK